MIANNYDCDQFCEVLPIERNRMRGLQSLRDQLFEILVLERNRNSRRNRMRFISSPLLTPLTLRLRLTQSQP
jgi:hypothetical protein